MGQPLWILRPIKIESLPPMIPIDGERVMIGRDAENGIRLELAMVSGHHAKVEVRDGRVHVSDLGSSNGTFVNDRRVESQELRHGDVLRLGDGGPAFAVVRWSGGKETTVGVTARDPHKPGAETIANVKVALGIPKEKSVDDMVRTRTRRILVVGIALAAIGLIGMLVALLTRGGDRRRVEALSQELARSIESSKKSIEARDFEWEEQRATLESERDRLREELKRHNEEGAEVAKLEAQLKKADEKLSLYNPVSLEQERLREIGQVRRAVVFIEKKIFYSERTTGKMLYAASQPDGSLRFNLEGEGQPFVRESSGSGFCISNKGDILTNEHVIRPGDPITTRPQGGFKPKTEISVVFTGESRRHAATVVRSTDALRDLSLIRIKPFKGMPVLPAFDSAVARPQPGTEVYLFGFPLGKLALQEGTRVIASTFKGILSRVVGGLYQIDAAVHPGNSGGPVTDSHGRVIGIVSRVQRTPEGTTAPAIGYVIPISEVWRVWPPK